MNAILFQHLATLLRNRVAIIADHAWRDRDPAAHLSELQRVSEEIEKEHQSLSAELPARLKHFLQQASYAKALDFIESSAASAHTTFNQPRTA